MNKLTEYSDYKNTIFNKLNFNFKEDKSILDLGCGPADDSTIFRDHFKLDVTCTDIYKHENIDKENFKFKKSSALDLEFDNNSFDYVIMHDVLHHVDEEKQDRKNHILALTEAKRVCKKGGYVIIIEGNRYNPLFYPHMVKQLGHDHFKQSYFISIITEAYGRDAEIKHFETHHYPYLTGVFAIYEWLMETFSPKQFLAYNAVIYQKQ